MCAVAGTRVVFEEVFGKPVIFLVVSTIVALVQIVLVGVELFRDQEDPRFAADKLIYRS